jgi:serine/threonine-protein kinase
MGPMTDLADALRRASHPARVGKYSITGVLGHGAMGVVYRAFDPGIQRPVAIKVIRRKLLNHDRMADLVAARFKNEARAVGRLSHPGIVAIYDYGEDDACAFIAMELVEGRSLGRILSRTPMLSEAELLRIMDQLLDALDCVHRHGVWHRDIKPENLIVTPRGEVKLADFGIARVEDVALTQGGPWVGTPGYMAPEQYTAVGLDHRVDIFAAGVLLYRLLTGKAPFKGRSQSVMRATLDDDPPAPSAAANTLRHAFYDSIISTALAKNPKARFASAAEFRGALSKRFEVAPAISSCVNGIEMRTLAASLFPDCTVTTRAFPEDLTTGSPRTPDLVDTAAASWTGLDAATLARAERALVGFVGPIGKVLVRKAARNCLDLASFSTALVEHVPPAQRRAFIERITAECDAFGVAMNASAGVLEGSPLPGPFAGSEPPGPELLAHACRVLTSRMGPIAAVVVKRVAGQAHTRAEFFRLLVVQCADGADRAKLSEELQQGPVRR